MNTIKAKFRKREKDEAVHVKRLKLDDSNISKDFDKCDDTAANEVRNWLNINDGPWTTVLDMWKACFPLRKRFLKKSTAVAELHKINLWRFIAADSGHQLVSNILFFIK